MDDLLFVYVPGSSLVHRLDPRTKIIAVMLISIFIFRAGTFFEMGTFVMIFALLVLLSKVSIRIFLKAIQPMIVFFTFIFLMQLFLTEGEALFSAGFIHPTREGLMLGTLLTTRFILLVLFASMLTATTRPTMITNGIERMLRPLPLKFIGISSFDLATMMSLSIRFLPLILDNARQVRDAQLSRGLDIRHDLLRGVSAISVPMIMSSMRMADDLAVAMGSRCYQGEHRTALFELRMRTIDWFALLGIGIAVVLAF